MTQNETNSKKEKSNRCLTSGGLLRWDVEPLAEWLATEGTAEDMLPSGTLLTGRMLQDEEFDMVTASTTSPAPRKNLLSQGIVCWKDGCFVPFHSMLQSE